VRSNPQIGIVFCLFVCSFVCLFVCLFVRLFVVVFIIVVIVVVVVLLPFFLLLVDLIFVVVLALLFIFVVLYEGYIFHSFCRYFYAQSLPISKYVKHDRKCNTFKYNKYNHNRNHAFC